VHAVQAAKGQSSARRQHLGCAAGHSEHADVRIERAFQHRRVQKQTTAKR
jgi:hypothetical protein